MSPDRGKWGVLRPSDLSPQKLAVLPPIADYLMSKGVKKEFLKDLPNVVLIPPKENSNLWLKGVILVGVREANFTFPPSYSAETTSTLFHTSADSINGHVRHMLSYANNPPEIEGENILGGFGLDLHAGISSQTAFGSTRGFRNYLEVPDKLKEPIVVEKRYLPEAILMRIESQTFKKLFEIHPELYGKLGIETLLATSLTPIK